MCSLAKITFSIVNRQIYGRTEEYSGTHTHKLWVAFKRNCTMATVWHTRADYTELELGDIPQKNRKEGIFVIPVSISSKKFYTGKPTYRKNGMDIDTYTLIHFYFHSVQCIQDIVRVKDSFNFYSYLILGNAFIHLSLKKNYCYT